MPDGQAASRRMRWAHQGNGYLTPTEYSSRRVELEKEAERRRHALSSGTSSDLLSSPADASQISDVLNGQKKELGGSRGHTSTVVGIRDRIACYTWTWFTLTMATGGIANVLRSIPYRANWLYYIGVSFMLLNILFFLINCVMITLRFRFDPGSLRASFTTQSESLFIPACVVSVGTILINVSQYGVESQGPWLQKAVEILFWMFATLSVIASCGIYLMLWSTQSFPIHNMTPIWIFPAYPLLLSAPLASSIIDALPSSVEATRVNALAMSIGAITLQGTGFLVSLNIYGAFIYRLMTQKLPGDMLKPGMFVSVGPSGFTAAGLVHLGGVLSTKVLPDGFQGSQDAAFVLKLVLELAGLWLWGLCIWFFFISVGAHWDILWPRDPEHIIHFNMTWYSFVFPNTALVTATLAIGKTLESNAIQLVGTVMAGILVVVWLLVFSAMIRALAKKTLLWPEENRDEDGTQGLNRQNNAGRS